MKPQDYVRAVAERLIEQLEQGTAPWVKPWSPGMRFMPYNPVTGKSYRGMNAILLLATAEALGYGDARWLTYRQAGGAGGQVRRGEQGTWIQYWKWREERPIRGEDGQPARDEAGTPRIEVIDYTRPRLFHAVVFNAAQIDGLPPPDIRPALAEWERHERAEAILLRSGADIRHEPRDRAAYNPIRDVITLPERDQFAGADGYYATALHELAHWTGHESRLNRDLRHPFGTQNYAREELRAEIASLMLGERLSIGYDMPQHAAYISYYIAILKDDPTEIFRAAGDAEKIIGFLQRFEQLQDIDPVKAIGRESVAMPATASMALKQAQPISDRVHLAVPYGEKNAAKALGAKWDKAARCWYAPPGADLAPFARWRNRLVSSPFPEDPRVEFAAALAQAGLILDGLPVMDGKLRRIAVEGGRRGERDGAYVGHLDGPPAGFIENFKTGYRTNWKSQMPRKALSALDSARLANEVAAHQRRREEERRAIAAETARLIEGLLDGMPPLRAGADHPYLVRKGVRAHGVYRNEVGPLELFAGEHKPQIWSGKGELLIPICDIDGALLGAQSIAEDGFKLFPRGAALAGGHHLIGDVAEGARLLIAEGYATAATLHEATGLPVAVAFNAGNLEPVARTYRERFPSLAIIVAGDNDHEKEREIGADGRPKANVGRLKAEAAAREIDGVAMIPPFRPEETGSDWNDLARLSGDGFNDVLSAALAGAERHLRAGSYARADRSPSPSHARLRGSR
jgi:putative DNA primase/helicase